MINAQRELTDRAVTRDPAVARVGALSAMPILIAHGRQANAAQLKSVLADAGFDRVIATTDAAEVTGLIEREHVELLVLDLHMQDVDAFELLAEVRSAVGERAVTVSVLLADRSVYPRRRALALGAR